MVEEEGFTVRNNFAANLNCPTKAECEDALYLDETSGLWTARASNQLIPYQLLQPLNVTYVGAGAICVDGDAPDPGAITAPTIVLTSQSSDEVVINWAAQPGSTPNGSISAYEVQIKNNVGPDPVWQTFPQLSGTTTTFGLGLGTGVQSVGLMTFRVRLIDSTSATSDWSNELEASNTEDNPTTATNPLNLTWEVSNNNDLFGEFKLSGDQNTTVTSILEVQSSSGTWYLQSIGTATVSNLPSSIVNGNTPYFWPPPVETLTNSESGYYFTYSVAAYGHSTGGSMTIKLTVISAPGYSVDDLPSLTVTLP